MREALIILAVLLILLALTAFKYRRGIATAIGIGRVMKKAVSANRSAQQPRIEEPVNSGKLVSCTKCGTWVPERRAIKFGASTFFCNDACLQNSIKSA